MSLKFRVTKSKWAPNDVFVVELDGKEIVRSFLNNSVSARVKDELKQMGLLEDQVEEEGNET